LAGQYSVFSLNAGALSSAIAQDLERLKEKKICFSVFLWDNND